MPIFQYEAMDTVSEKIKDVIEAPNVDEAQAAIRQQGYFVTKISLKAEHTQPVKSVRDKMVEACEMTIHLRVLSERAPMDDFLKRNIAGAAAVAELALQANDVELEQAKSCICTFCGAENSLDWEDFDPVESGQIHQRATCEKCGKYVNHVFTLTDVRELVAPKQKLNQSEQQSPPDNDDDEEAIQRMIGEGG